MCKHILLKLTQSWQPPSTTNQKLLTDKSKLFVCQISRLGFAYSYITIIITITHWKDMYFPKSWPCWSEIGENSSGFICSAECYCWLGGLVLRATISAILSFIHLWEDPTQRAAKVLCRRTSLFLHPRPLSAPFLFRTSGKVILKVNLARLSPFSNPFLCNLVIDGSSLKNLLARPVLECVLGLMSYVSMCFWSWLSSVFCFAPYHPQSEVVA